MDLIYFNRFLKIKKTVLIAILSVFFALTASNTFAISAKDAHSEVNKEHEAFDPGKAILEHIADSHRWTIFGDHGIDLPVILFTDKGAEFFSGGVFHQGETAYQGKYYTYKLIEDKIKVVDANGNLDNAASHRIYDFSITKNIIALWIACILLLVIFISVANAYKKRTNAAPKGLQSLLEPVIIFVRDEIAKPNIGYKYQRYMPLLLTIFFFIWVNNMLGLIPLFPGGANVTGNILFTFVLAFFVLLIVNLSANKYYWKHIFMPDVPWWLYPIMWPVELIGVISRPFALMIRLYANISAGHIIVLSLISMIFIFKSLLFAPISIAFVLFMDVLELLVAFLQAFIFTILTALFIGAAIEEHHI